MIIHHLSQTDAYKVSMAYVIYHYFRTYRTGWSFKFRNPQDHKSKMTKGKMQEWVDAIQAELEALGTLHWTDEEIQFLIKKMPWLTIDGGEFLDYLRNYQVRPSDIHVYLENDELKIETDPKVSWLQSTFYEIYTLAIVNETGFKILYDYPTLLENHKKNTDAKLAKLLDGTYVLGAVSEFGLRRELSEEAQDYTIGQFVKYREDLRKKGTNFVGTSNIYMAMKYDITPVGTMAHEYVMGVGQGDPSKNPAYSNMFAMDYWTKAYGVLNGIYLTDTIGDAVCKLDMNYKFASSYKGVRHDSGDPYVWGESWIDHYTKLGIDSKTKTLLFSDSLNFEIADNIYKTFKDRAMVAFGIGTYLSNDTGIKPFNIVMKMTTCNGHPVAKISNDPGKGMCKDAKYVEYLTRARDWRINNGY